MPKPGWYRSGTELIREIRETELPEEILSIWYLGQAGIVVKSGRTVTGIDLYLRESGPEALPDGREGHRMRKTGRQMRTLLKLAAFLCCMALSAAGCGQSVAEYQAAEAQEAVSGLHFTGPRWEPEQVPAAYLEPAENGGSLETLTYRTKAYASRGEELEKGAQVYLPPSFDPAGEEQYPLLVLLHGEGGDETALLGNSESPSPLKSLLDHMILEERIPPLIVVTPTYYEGGEHDEIAETAVFYQELLSDLLPAVEAAYPVFRDEDGLPARDHRAIGGVSSGAAVTWHLFNRGMAYFSDYLPLNGVSWAMGENGGETGPVETGEFLATTAYKSGFTAEGYRIFTAAAKEEAHYGAVLAQLDGMKYFPEQFVRTESGFSEGNLLFYEAAAVPPDTTGLCDSLYNGLSALYGL